MLSDFASAFVVAGPFRTVDSEVLAFVAAGDFDPIGFASVSCNGVRSARGLWLFGVLEESCAFDSAESATLSSFISLTCASASATGCSFDSVGAGTALSDFFRAVFGLLPLGAIFPIGYDNTFSVALAEVSGFNSVERCFRSRLIPDWEP